ncbi:quinone oxidoreductase family protein [Rhodococcus sp. 077-4]|uniref:quinone oxidoreductase family protein n=1 Tax=Rhodococcus sp. 077-4 TaxID=2789271 RepID=UPI0039F4DA6D
MKAIVVAVNGGPEKSALTEIPTPDPKFGEVRIKVARAGVNYLDVYQRQGALPAPFVAGVEGLGRVDATGPGVDPAMLGRRVGWLGGQGSFAEFVTMPEDRTVAVPDDIDDDIAIALLMQGLTAHYLATTAFAVNTASTVLIHAGAGGVGRLLIQVAKHLGATVIATASTAAKRRIAVDAGADHAVDYEAFATSAKQLTNGVGVDVVYDGVGKDTVEQDLPALAIRGTLIVIGAASGTPPAVEFAALAAKSLTITRPSIAHYTARPGELTRRAEEVFQWARDGILTANVAGRYRLEDVSKAQQDLQSRSISGKLVVDIE